MEKDAAGNMIKKHLLVFDIDGTLTDSVLIHQAAFVKALKQLGVEEMDQQFHTYKHHTDLHIAKTIYESSTKKPFDKTTIEQFEEILYRYILESSAMAEIKGAARLLKQVDETTDYGICYATGSMFKPAKHKLESIGIHCSPLQLTACNEIEDREGILSHAIQNAKTHYGVDSFQRIISIGDGLWDLKTARNLGLEFIGIGQKNKEVLEQHGMSRHWEHYDELESDCFLASCKLIE